MKATYCPQEPHDPAITTVAGVTFHANQPVEIGGVSVAVLVREETETSTGIRGKGVEKKMPLAELLSGNPYFKVEGENGAREGEIQSPKKGRPKNPATPEEYRAWAINWFKQAKTTKEMHERWVSEKQMRAKLGVHDDGYDVSYLRPFYESRFEELKNGELANA